VFEIGNSLREARHRQQLDLTDVEQATKIRARYLRALEEEAFDVLPAQTYVKGFLRTYADWLGLDGQLYVDEYNSRFGTDDEPREPVVARRTAGVHQRHARLARRGVLIALGAIAVLCALVIAAFKFSGGGDNQIPNLGPTTTAASQKPKPKKQRRAHVVRPAKVKFFVLAANGPSWMDVRNYSSNGRTLFTGTVDKGQSHGWTARRLWINFGSPSNVKVVVNHRVVPIPGGGSSVTVLVTRTGIVLAPATA
jgi:cytoskeleton protein RodZ